MLTKQKNPINIRHSKGVAGGNRPTKNSWREQQNILTKKTPKILILTLILTLTLSKS